MRPYDEWAPEPVKVAMIRLMATRLAGQHVTWANATEREALRRMKIETQLAA